MATPNFAMLNSTSLETLREQGAENKRNSRIGSQLSRILAYILSMTDTSNPTSDNGFNKSKDIFLRAIDVPYGYLVEARLDKYRRRLGINVESTDIPIYLEIDSREEFYWSFGRDMLEQDVRPSQDGDNGLGITWSQLHRFVYNYAWIEPSWSFITEKPCWPLHADVTEKVVSLFCGVRWHEFHRSEESPAQITSFYHMTKTLALDVTESLTNCRLIKVSDPETDTSYSYVRHHAGYSALGWMRSLVHQVLEFEGGFLPSSPVMNTSFPIDRFEREDGDDDDVDGDDDAERS